jgi:hypothetical protein
MAHDDRCDCAFCREVRMFAVRPEDVDRVHLANEWERWRGLDDGEVRKLRAGENGNPGSPRWIALQAIARARMAAEKARVVTIR